MSKMYVVTLPRMISCVTAGDAASVIAVVINSMQGGVSSSYGTNYKLYYRHVPLEEVELPSVLFGEVEDTVEEEEVKF